MTIMVISLVYSPLYYLSYYRLKINSNNKISRKKGPFGAVLAIKNIIKFKQKPFQQ